MTSVRASFFLFVAIAAAGCVTRADFEKMRREQQEMRALLADTQVSVDKANRRLDTLQSSVADRGASASDVDALERRVANLEYRLGQPGGAPLGGVVPLEPAAPAQRTEAAVIALRREESRMSSGAVNETYRRALDLYRRGQADQASEQFRQFLRTAGSSDLTDNAQYWIGEAYYSQGDYNRAIIELNEVLLKYPQGDQVPGALLALATAFANSGDKIDARLILQKLISDHPQTEEAVVGRQQLQALTD